jgi:capsule polysaccharide export protein KpsE/RkpR
MKSQNTFDIADFFILIVKWKKFLLFTLFFSAVISYLSIYFFVEEKYDSYGLIIPSEDDSFGSLAGLFGDLQGGLPFGLTTTSPEMSMYYTLIYSRTMLSEIVDKFNLIEVYNIDTGAVDYYESAVERLSDNISAEETEFMAYAIKVRSPEPNLSADMVNFIIQRLNEKLIKFKIIKSKDNKLFLSQRVSEVKQSLKAAEDSLNSFQKETGILNAEEQVKGLLAAFNQLETNLIASEIQLSVMNKIYSEGSPELKNIYHQVNEYKKKLKILKDNGSENNLLLALKGLPDSFLAYYRLLREVEINTKMLQFLLPLYEQAKLEEQKEIPVLRVIDYGVPAPKKDFPPRLIFTVIILTGVFAILMIYIFLVENKELQNSEKVKFIKANIFRWKNN